MLQDVTKRFGACHRICVDMHLKVWHVHAFEVSVFGDIRFAIMESVQVSGEMVMVSLHLALERTTI